MSTAVVSSPAMAHESLGTKDARAGLATPGQRVALQVSEIKKRNRAGCLAASQSSMRFGNESKDRCRCVRE